MEHEVRRAEILMEALPYIREFRGKSVIIKYGGAAMAQASLKETFALDVILLQLVGINPVIAPVGVGGGGETYNINADLVAGEVAAALGAEKLIHLTDVQGIKGTDGKLVSTLARKDAEGLMKQGVIDGGMLPKVESSLRALEGGTAKAHIIDGRLAHAILLELFTREGIGTEIVL